MHLREMASLQKLWLLNNALTGDLPLGVEKCQELESLRLQDNSLSLEEPRNMAALSKLSKLKHVNLQVGTAAGQGGRAVAVLRRAEFQCGACA